MCDENNDKKPNDENEFKADESQRSESLLDEPKENQQPLPPADAPSTDKQDDASSKMKEQVVDISKKIGRAFSDFGKKFARESSDMLEQGKLEVRIITLDKKLRELEADLGRKLFNLWSMGRIRDEFITEMLSNELNEIDKYDEERAIAKELLDNIRYKPEGE